MLHPAEPPVTVIIPAYNEAQTIGELVTEIRERYPAFEVIVVDDGSSDDTGPAAAAAGAQVHRHPYNIGNGAAIKSGIRLAAGQVLVFMDADNQHRPEDIAALLTHLPAHDMVVGARGRRYHATWLRAAGNWLFDRFASYVAKFRVEDLTSGYRAIKTPIARRLLYLLPNTYSYPTTLTLAILRNGWSLKYVPIHTRRRTAGRSRIHHLKDGVRFIMIIIKICTLYSPLRIFLPVSGSMFLLGLSYYLYTFTTMRRFTNMSALLLTTAVIIFMMGMVSEQICQLRFADSEQCLPPAGESIHPDEPQT